MGMGTENENEASFAKKQKSWTGQPEDSFYKIRKRTDYAIKFSVSFRLKRLLYMGLVFDKKK